MVLGGALILLLVAVIASGPWLLGRLAPTLAARAPIPGHLAVRDASLSWLGGLRVGEATLYDADGNAIAGLRASTGGGLLGLLDGVVQQDVVVEGWAHVVVAEDGTTNIERALGLSRGARGPAAPPPPPASRDAMPVRRIVVDGLRVVVTPPGGERVSLVGSGNAAFDGGALSATFDGRTGTVASAGIDAASIAAMAPGRSVVALDAQLDLGTLSGTASARLADLPPQLAAVTAAWLPEGAGRDALAIALAGGLDAQVQIELDRGAPIVAVVDAESDTLRVDLRAKSGNDAIALAAPATLRLDADAFLRSPSVRRLVLASPDVDLERAGMVELSIATARVPRDGGVPAWHAATGRATVAIEDATLRVPGPDGRPVGVDLSGATLEADRSAAGPARIAGRSGVALAGERPGRVEFEVDIGVEDLAAVGALERAMLARAFPAGSVTIEGLPTGALAPWLRSLRERGIELAEAAGPVLAADARWGVADDGRPEVSARVQAKALDAEVAGLWTDRGIEIGTTPARIRLGRPAMAVAPLLPEGWTLRGDGDVRLTILDALLPIDGGGFDPALATGALRLDAGGFEIVPPGGPPVRSERLAATLGVARDASMLSLSIEGGVDGRPATLAAELSAGAIASLAGATLTDPPAVVGTIEASAATTALGALDIDAAGRPLQRWLADAIGPEASVRLTLREPAEGRAFEGVLFAGGPHGRVRTEQLRMVDGRLAANAIVATGEITPALWSAVAPLAGLEGSSLAAPAGYEAKTGAASLELANLTAWRAALEEVPVELAFADPIGLRGLPVGADDAGAAVRRDVSIRGLRGTVDALGPALAAEPGWRAGLSAEAWTPGDQRIGSIQATAAAPDAERVVLEATATEVDVPSAMTLAGLDASAPSMVGALGGSASIDARMVARRGDAGALALAAATLDLQGDRLKTTEPLELRAGARTMRIAEPVRLAWSPDADWMASELGLGVASASPIAIEVRELAMGNAMAAGEALLDPQLFRLAATVSGDGVALRRADGGSGRLDDVRIEAHRTGPGVVAIDAAAVAPNGGRLDLSGVVAGLGASGGFSMDDLSATLVARGDEIPVGMVDSLAGANGLLLEGFGNLATLDAQLDDAVLRGGGLRSGSVRASIRGPRAAVLADGRIDDGVLRLPGQQTVLTLNMIRPDVADRFGSLIPQVLHLEKRPEDGPATLVLTDAAVPLDGDLARLDLPQGQLALGTARFETTPAFANILQLAGRRDAGLVGRRLQPIRARVERGVVAYEPFELPLGEFTLESEGTIDLVGRRMDILTWIPLGALSDEAAGRFGMGLGRALGRSVPGLEAASMVPWRTSGPFGRTTTAPAPEQLIERRGREFFEGLDPSQAIRDIFRLPGG